MPPTNDSNENDAVKPVPTWMLVVSATMMAISAVIYVAIFLGGSRAIEMFQVFGTDLPVFTTSFLSMHKFYAVLFLVVAIPTFRLFKDRAGFLGSGRSLMIATIGFGISIVVLGLYSAAMYLPILEIGPVVPDAQ